MPCLLGLDYNCSTKANGGSVGLSYPVSGSYVLCSTTLCSSAHWARRVFKSHQRYSIAIGPSHKVKSGSYYQSSGLTRRCMRGDLMYSMGNMIVDDAFEEMDTLPSIEVFAAYVYAT